MTRTGKIARLPLAIRNALCSRLQNGDLGKTLVAWLNTLPDVQQIMAAQFEGRPITQQNLSEWRQGGYRDWLRHQESLDCAHRMREQAAELAEATNGAPLSEVLATHLAVALAKSLRTLMSQPLDTPEQRRQLLALSQEINRLRREDSRAATLKLHQEKQTSALPQQAQHRSSQAQENTFSAQQTNTPGPSASPGQTGSIRPNQTGLNPLTSTPGHLTPAKPSIPHFNPPQLPQEWRRAG